MKRENTEELKKEIIRLQKELERYRKNKYGLVWMEREEEFDVATRNKLPILREVKEKAITNDDDKPTHIIIEGDNYHALTCLNYTHKEKIDLIYIDPPYNTGNKDFKYNDSFIDKESPFRHSAWLSFMSKRLDLARNLLRKSGVIFISIDDNEMAQLKLLYDKIFGEGNHIATNIWEKIHSVKNDAKYLSENHEYLLLYCKNIAHVKLNLLTRTGEMNARYKNPDNDSRGVWQSGDLAANETRKDGNYEVVNPTTGKSFYVPAGKHWVYSKENMGTLIKENRIWFGKKGDAFPRKKRFLSEVANGRKGTTLWFSEEVGHNQEGKRELKNFFEQSDSLFTNPKPTRLITRTLELSSNKNSIVLDFFAGSGTTMESTVALNEEDNGKRQCILINSNKEEEGFICEKITYERNKRVIEGYTKPNGEKVDALGNSLKYYRTDFIGKNQIDQVNDDDQIELCYHVGELLALAENTLYEIFKNEYFQIFADNSKKGKHFTAIYFQENLNEFDAFETKIHSLKGKVTAYIFSWSEGEFDDVFDTSRNVAVKSIPQPILEIYKNILSA